MKVFRNKRSVPDFSSGKDKIKRTNSMEEVKVWTNERAKTVNTVEASINLDIEEYMIALDRCFPDVEFSIFTNFRYDEDQRLIIVGPKIFVPKQRVNIGGVEYDEDAPEGFNCVIHKHPLGCNWWSVVDMEYINSNFEVSILFIKNRFTTGMARVKTKFGWVPVDLNCVVGRKFPTIENEILSKIKKVPAPNFYRSNKTNMGRSSQPVKNNYLSYPIGMDEYCFGEENDDEDSFLHETHHSKVQEEINKTFGI